MEGCHSKLNKKLRKTEFFPFWSGSQSFGALEASVKMKTHEAMFQILDVGR